MDNEFTNNPIVVKWIAKVPKKLGDKALKYLHTHDWVEDSLIIAHIDDSLLIPLNESFESQRLIVNHHSIEFDLIHNLDSSSPISFSHKTNHKIPLLRDAVASIIPPNLLQFVPKSYDIIGTIAILEMNRYEQTELNPYMLKIANTMLKTNPSLTTVIGKAGDVDGVFRTRKYELLAGQATTQTIHKENNSRFKLDIEKTFFTPRLVFERKRISEFTHPLIENGITWDMFCGVGPFIIQIAKNFPNRLYLGTDINPNAIEFARTNAQLNHIIPKIEFYAQDLLNISSVDYFQTYHGKISQIIMNLPEFNLNFLSLLPSFIQSNGAIIHIYQFNEKDRPCEQAEELFRHKCKEVGLSIQEILLNRIVKPFSPSKDTTVIDAIIQKLN